MSDSGASLFDLFREEVASHTATLAQGLLDLEKDSSDSRKIEPLMRAAHSIKGAARIVGVDAAVELAHKMEDAFVAAGAGKVRIEPKDVDILLRGVDLLSELGRISEGGLEDWRRKHADELTALGEQVQALASSSVGRISNPSPAPESASKKPPTKKLALRAEPVEVGGENPMFDLFREEVRAQTAALLAGWLALQEPNASRTGEPLLQAAHSLKGAARIVAMDEVAELADALETAFVQGKPDVRAAVNEEALFRALDVLAGVVEVTAEGVEKWRAGHSGTVHAVAAELTRSGTIAPTAVLAPVETPPRRMPVGPDALLPSPLSQGRGVGGEGSAFPPLPRRQASGEEDTEPEAVVRVTAESLTRLMSLVGESLVQARWLQPFSAALLKLKKQQDNLVVLLARAEQSLTTSARQATKDDQLDRLIAEARKQAGLCRQTLAERLVEFDDHAALVEDLDGRLYREVIASRMRPFADGAHGFPRLVRDMARRLGRQVRLEIDGLTTEVDRDVLEQLEAPLMHLLRNAVDHGVEPPEVRRASGKPEEGLIRLEVLHRAGMLHITVSDDGAGINRQRLAEKIVERKLTTPDLAGSMAEPELLEFLFLPGFSTATAVTEYSGRGVGLDVVQTTIRKIGGNVRVSTRAGQGTTFHLQLPVTLSVLRAVLVDVAGEPYAFPHNRIDGLIRVPRRQVRSLEHRQFVTVNGHNVGLVLAEQMIGLDPPQPGASGQEELAVLLMSDQSNRYGLIVDDFRGEQDLVVRPLDPRLGKAPNVSAAAILDNGEPVLIADVEDLIRSMDHFIQSGSLRRCDEGLLPDKRRKRVLVADDSITVREVERQLLRNQGYDVSVAVDGQDAWNQLRAGVFDLVVTDIDMPRLSGLDLVKLIRDHEPVKDLPIIIVSYKDRDEDRLLGLDLGANFYLTKSSFHDNTLLRAVEDLIGGA